MAKTKTPDEFVMCPFSVIVDTREQHPYRFHNLRADSAESKRAHWPTGEHAPLVVRIVRAALSTGDYSIDGMEDVCTVERKSKEDAYQTFSRDRERFERELVRMKEIPYRKIVIESARLSFFKHPPPETQVNPKTIYRQILAWELRYQIPFTFCDTRNFAERETFRVLDRAWKDKKAKKGHFAETVQSD